jgi:hypothetical protein
MRPLNGLAYVAVVLTLACNSTGVGNPPAVPAEVNLALTQDSAVEPGAEDNAQLDEKRIEHAVIVLGKIVVLACSTKERDVKLEGPFVVDLATNRIEPNLPMLPVPAGGVCGIDAVLAPAVAPAALAGRSIFFSGTRRDETRFLLFADMPGTLHLRPRNDSAWSVDHGWLWALRPRRWLSPTELDESDSEVLASEGRVIVINVNRHPLLYKAIRSRLAGRSSLHLDLNDNFVLDDDERSGDAVIGVGLDSLD